MTIKFLGAAIAALAIVSPAAAGITLTFDEMPNYDRPYNFYAGGSSIDAGTEQATGRIGPNLGVSITDAAIVFQAFDQCPGGGCNGVFPTAPSGNRAMYNFAARTNLPALTTFNLAAGFTGEASVWHYGGASSMTVYRGLGGRDGDGGFPTVLGFAAMPLTTGCVVNPNTLTVTGCGWTKYTVAFTGTAQSLVLAGRASYFDNVTFGASGPSVGGVPEPASWAMLIAGFGLTGAAMRRRRMAVVAA
nr:PEPxxWA-CTERM sorting domain-containing protein [Polymorphobacter sp.]